MKRTLAILLTMVLLLALCPAGTLAAEGAAGKYTIFTIDMMGTQTDPAVLGLEGYLALYEDGTGKFVVDGDEQTLASWSIDGKTITASDGVGSTETLTLENGVIEMDLGGGVYLYLAREGVDLKDFRPWDHSTGSRTAAIYKGVDAKKGAHLDYEFHADYMDSTSILDVHAKDGMYYSGRVTKAGGYEQPSATLYRDGKAYNLYPDEKRGTVALSYSSSLLTENILLMDELFKEIYECAFRKDFTEEKRELEGVQYTAEVFPAQDYSAEAVFFYDDAGRLVHVLVGPPVYMPDFGETFYTVRSIDDKVDETLFDLSGYTITE